MQTLDARGKSCPMPIVLAAKAMKALAPGDRLFVLADDRAFPEDIRAWCSKTGNDLLSLAEKPSYFEAEVRRSR
jgi:tRNA 2-thiouridine synthesizing protein A